jgi:ATP-dependent Lhr-like helicase
LCGKEWLVERINKKSLSIYVSPIKNGGELYPWRGPKAKIDVSIVRKMRTIYESSSLYPYLDSKTNAAQDLTDARAYYLQNHLKESQFVHGEIDDTYFTWAGSKVNETIALIIELYLGKDWCFSNSISVFGVNESDIRETVLHNKPNPIALAALVKREDKITQKYDYLLSDDLLNLEYASTYLDVDAAWDVMNKTLGCSTL